MWGRSTSPSNSTEFPISPRYAGIPSRLRESQPSLRIDEKADVARLVEQPIRNALSLAYVVVEYGGFRVVVRRFRVSLSTICTAFCTAI
jgi:hypothetical protein